MSNTGVSKLIVVDARCFDLEHEVEDSNFNDVYLARFLHEAIEDGYDVQILTEGDRISKTAEAIEAAVSACNAYLGETINLDALQASIRVFFIDPKHEQYDRIKELEWDALTDRPDQFGCIDLIVSPIPQIQFGALFNEYIAYKHPKELDNVTAYIDFETELPSAADFQTHTRSSAIESANRQLIMAEDDHLFHRIFGNAKDRELSRIGENKKIFSFCNRHPFTVQTPSEKPDISEGEFLLTHYFANLLREQNPNKSIGEEGILEAENTDLIIRLSEMADGDVAIEEVRQCAHNTNIPHPFR